MISYIIESAVFQMLFLMVYEGLLKKETFFQGNRIYLLITFSLSLVLPFIRLDSFAESIQAYPALSAIPLTKLDEIVLLAESTQVSLDIFKFLGWGAILGMLISALFLFIKFRKIFLIQREGTVMKEAGFKIVLLHNSWQAFSFLKTVYLGDQICPEDKDNILQHELVHVRQGHSLDLIFFECFKVMLWFNPLVYLYQNRIREVHEFLADSTVSVDSGIPHYQRILTQAFKVKDISFINQFYQSSLIKKRIVMLNKSKSTPLAHFKFVAILPLMVAMLFYTSCQEESHETQNTEAVSKIPDSEVIPVTAKQNTATVSFAEIDEVPVFPGCEDAADARQCFIQSITRHVRKNFNYPEIARERGIQGKVNLLFFIMEDGTVGEIKYRGADEILEKEAVRIIEKLPVMQPGREDGQAVRMPFSIPITFKLQ